MEEALEQQASNPEIGKSIEAAGFRTNYHDHGTGFPVILIHGSGPGVSAWANWRLIIPGLAAGRRVIAPDMVGFGFTERPVGVQYGMDLWVKQLLALMDKLDIAQTDLVGNSFGGGLSLSIATRYPDLIRRVVLMGSAGLEFPITEGLDTVWGYEPSVANMRRAMDYFTYDKSLVSDELAELRYKASILPGAQEAFSAMFPAPRQRWVKALSTPEEKIAGMSHETLIIHGREDVILPMEGSVRLHKLISRSQLHIFGRCGHWTQIEQAARFEQLVTNFLDEAKK
jgi:2-hydroxymuconate-semialdehyde hydrolase